MATGAQGIERIAKGMNIPLLTVDRVSRLLKQHKPALWALAGQGGGKKARHLEPEHLVNIVLALAWADPLTNSPATVLRLREMARKPGATLFQHHDTALASGYAISRAPNEVERDVEGATLGEMLDSYVLRIATDPQLREQYQREGLELSLQSWPFENAFIRRRKDDLSTADAFDGLGLLSAVPPAAPPAAIQRFAVIPFATFDLLADLYADTLRFQQKAVHHSLLPPVAPNAGPETKSAAPSPKSAAPIRDQERANAPVPMGGHSEANREREQSQPLPRAPGRSHHRHRRPRDGRTDTPVPSAP